MVVVPPLKNKNKYIGVLLLFDTIILWAILSELHSNSLADPYAWRTFFGITGLLASLTTAVGILITYLISSDAKATLVFWRVRNSLPGCSAFSHHVHSDPRIDATALKKKCGPFPSDPQEQNALWYKLYKKNETDARIRDSQQMFLFFRDAASISLLIFLVIGMLYTLGVPAFQRCGYALVVMAIQYFLFVVAARNTANRFVRNVLAIEATAGRPSRRLQNP
jgi:hypothetical protein